MYDFAHAHIQPPPSSQKQGFRQPEIKHIWWAQFVTTSLGFPSHITYFGVQKYLQVCVVTGVTETANM